MESLPAEEKGRKNGHNFVQDGMGRARRVVTHFGRQWNADRGNGRPTTPDRERAADFSNTTPHCDVCIKREEGVAPCRRLSVRHLH